MFDLRITDFVILMEPFRKMPPLLTKNLQTPLVQLQEISQLQQSPINKKPILCVLPIVFKQLAIFISIDF